MKVGSIVTSGKGPNCFMGTIVKISGAWATVKYLDFKVAREVPLAGLKAVGAK